jgi:hypothetical protein
LVAAPDLGSGASRRGGSSPSVRTLKNQLIFSRIFLIFINKVFAILINLNPMNHKKLILSLLAIVLFSLAYPQCKNFVKKKCLPSLTPYVTNCQISTANLSPGDHAEIPVSFFENTSYRIIVCGQEILGKINYKLLDANKNVVFDNSQYDFANSWDFSSTSNQSLTLVLDVPSDKSDNHSQMMHTGCVSIIIGFKKG